MKQPAQVTQEGKTAAPTQVWETLTVRQQKTVMQAVVTICRTLVAQWVKENDHEPARRP
jgi:hypothetical protein